MSDVRYQHLEPLHCSNDSAKQAASGHHTSPTTGSRSALSALSTNTRARRALAAETTTPPWGALSGRSLHRQPRPWNRSHCKATPPWGALLGRSLHRHPRPWSRSHRNATPPWGALLGRSLHTILPLLTNPKIRRPTTLIRKTSPPGIVEQVSHLNHQIFLIPDDMILIAPLPNGDPNPGTMREPP